MSLQDLRHYFPMLKQGVGERPFIYLDSAATTLKPEMVVHAMSEFYLQKYGTVHRAVYSTAAYATEQYEAVRQAVCRFIHARTPQEVIFTRGTTDSINIIAFSLSALLKRGDCIAISEMEHHSNIVPWQMAAELYGLQLVILPVTSNGSIDLDKARELLLKHSVRIVAITHISNILGTITPLTSIASLCREVGAYFVVDGAQAVAHLAIDVQAIGCDFYVFSGHKMYGPTGVGILWGKEEILTQMPPLRGGGDMIETVTFNKTTYAPLPLKFEPGTPMIGEVIGLGAALRFLNEIGLDALSQHERALTKHLYAGLKALSRVILLGPENDRGALVSMYFSGAHPLDVATLLNLKGIAVRSGHLCGQPILQKFGSTAALRASIGCYTTQEDIECFLQALASVLQKI